MDSIRRYRIIWASFYMGQPVGEGEVTVQVPDKPHPISQRSRALNAADGWLRKNRDHYRRANAWALRIEDV